MSTQTNATSSNVSFLFFSFSFRYCKGFNGTFPSGGGGPKNDPFLAQECGYLSGDSVVFPPLEQSAMFITTRVTYLV